MDLIQHAFELIQWAVDVVLHLDARLNALVLALGPWTYALAFTIVFCETGLVVTPFLPGDSLLFALGSLTAVQDPALSLPALMILLSAAGVLGDAANYAAGRYVGPRVFVSDTSRFLNRRHLLRARDFYERYGGKAIILARFIPVIRTFAPFVAGIGRMRYRRFAIYNVVGGVSWVGGFLAAGHLFGDLPVVRANFHLVILAIIVLSCLPAAAEYERKRRARRRRFSTGAGNKPGMD